MWSYEYNWKMRYLFQKATNLAKNSSITEELEQEITDISATSSIHGQSLDIR